MEAWVAAIKIRACRRIGEIGKALDRAQGERTDRLRPGDGTKSKHAAIEAAGLSTSTVHRYEKLAEMVPHLKEEARKRQATSTGGSNPQLAPDRAEAESGEAIEIAARMVGVGHQPRAFAADQQHPRLELMKCSAYLPDGTRCPNRSRLDRCPRHRRRKRGAE
jgi:hypothetical protein